jgi:hypothetical protein
VTRFKFLLVSLLLLAAVSAFAVETAAGPYRLSVSTQPDPVPVGRANLVITVKDAKGQPVSGAQVRAIARMPGMFMGEREQPATPDERPGVYVAPAVFGMAGGYEVEVSVSGPQGSAKGIAQLSTGESSQGSSGPALGLYIAIGVALALAAFVWRKAKQSGQRVDARKLFTSQAVVSLVVSLPRLPSSFTPSTTGAGPGR